MKDTKGNDRKKSVPEIKGLNITTHIHNNVVPNRLQAYMQSNTVPGVKPEQEVITTCSHTSTSKY